LARLTPKQERFVAEYLIDLNATAAARRAGYSAKTADRIGPELLGKTCVSQAIQEARKARQERTGITQDMVVDELAAIAFHEANDAPEAELKVSNKLKALELLGKHLGLFTDKAEANVKLEGSMEVVPLSQRRAILDEIADEYGRHGR